MSDMLADGLAWLTKTLRASASQQVSYAGLTDTFTPQATFGQQLLKLDDGQGGFRMEWTDMDFLIPAADLQVPNVPPIIPTRGDTITVQNFIGMMRVIETYEVFAPGGEAPWRWADPHKTMYRIHTKLVSSVSMP